MHVDTPLWMVLPFCFLLFSIALGPLFFPVFWHKHYPTISCSTALIVSILYILQKNYHTCFISCMEYIQFIALITALYMVASSVIININGSPNPIYNLLFLIFGSIISNIIGTTGASMLLIRPYIRINRPVLSPYHVIFFTFMVGNIGGALTPIGDPPLFLGFLKGVPFFWTLINNFPYWALAIIILSIIFYVFEYRNKAYEKITNFSSWTISIQYKYKIIWMAVIVLLIFVDPHLFSFIPSIKIHHHTFSFLRETGYFFIAGYLYYTQPDSIRKNFTILPLREVAFLFFGIFGTMEPAMHWVNFLASSPTIRPWINARTLYFSTGILSSFLDNAPTYVSFLSAGMAACQIQSVIQYSIVSARLLRATSLAAVFWGAMTYIGNSPNFMIKSIAEEEGVRMPSFLGYIFHFSLPYLFPILLFLSLLI